MIRVKPTKETKSGRAFIKSLSKRVHAVALQVGYQAASGMRDAILDSLPGSKEVETYKKSITFGRVKSYQGGGQYAVFSDRKATGVKEQQPQSTLITVKVKKNWKGGEKEMRALKLLAKYGPWTMDTLPFTPTAAQADVTQRKVPIIAVQRAQKQLDRTQQKWKREFRAAGVKDFKKTLKDKLNKTTDVYGLALALEFGLGKTKIAAAWRPAQRGLGDLINKSMKDNSVKDTLNSPKANAWKTWPMKTPKSPTQKDIESFKEWQEKVKLSAKL